MIFVSYNLVVVIYLRGGLLMKYELFLVSGDPITSFESQWQFQQGEQIFFHDKAEKRNLIIARITHDVNKTNEHVVRLYCQEKKVY